MMRPCRCPVRAAATRVAAVGDRCPGVDRPRGHVRRVDDATGSGEPGHPVHAAAPAWHAVQYRFRGGRLAGRPLRGLLAAGPTVTSLWLQSLDSTTAKAPGRNRRRQPSILVPRQPVDCVQRPWRTDEAARYRGRGGAGARRHPRNLPDGRGEAWGRDGSILFGTTTALYRLSDTGGTPQTLTKSDAARQETHFRFPEFLPDGKRFLYWIGSPNPDVEGTYLGSLERPNERVRIMGGKDKAIYAPPRDGEPAYLLFLRDQSLLAQRFDVDARRLDGEPIRVTDGFPTSPGSPQLLAVGRGPPRLSYRRTEPEPEADMDCARRRQTRGRGTRGRYQSIRISPDGKDVALDGASGVEDLWRFEFARGVRTILTDNPRPGRRSRLVA